MKGPENILADHISWLISMGLCEMLNPEEGGMKIWKVHVWQIPHLSQTR